MASSIERANQELESYTNGDLDKEEAKLKVQIGLSAGDANQNKDHEAEEEADVNERNRRLEEEAVVASALAISKAKKEWAKKLKKMTLEDISEATFRFLHRWVTPVIPPEKIIPSGLIEKCSRAIRKQLTESDVSGEEQSKLALAKSQAEKKFRPLLEESEIPRGKDGIKFPVYGPDGKVYEMKMWANEKTADLTTGWRKFVGDYELKENCDFVTIWMFKHRGNRQICLAIDCTRLSLRYQVTKKISKSVFKD